jgi:hypothetical protein
VAAVPVAGLAVVLAGWAAFRGRDRPEPVDRQVIDAIPGPLVQTDPQPSQELAPPDDHPLPPLDRRWVPQGTELVFSVRLSFLAQDQGFDGLLSFAEPYWQPAVGAVMEAFGLRSEAVDRLCWMGTNLDEWPERAVVVIRLNEGQDAGVFEQIGEPVDLRLDGHSCFRLKKEKWPHPFAVVDEETIVTGSEELLRELSDRTEARLASVPIDYLLRNMTSGADLVLAVDAAAARLAGWQLPITLMDVWPAGRDPWHVLWETPIGLGLSYGQSGENLAEVVFVCDGQTSAGQVRAALDALVPAARAAMAAEAASLGEKLHAGRITAQVSNHYELALEQGKALLEASHWEVVDQAVWIRVDWAESMFALASSALASRPAFEAAWFDAARGADEAKHRRLLSGLVGHQKAEGHFPAGAAGGVVLPPETQLSWIATMLPYYDHSDWYRELNFAYSWNGAQNQPVTKRRLEAVINPAQGANSTQAGFPVTHYAGVAGLGPDAGSLPAGHPKAGVFGYGRKTRAEDISDGASNSIAILGVSDHLGAWAAGGPATVRALTRRPYFHGPDGFGSGQPNGMLAGMADRSVRFLSKDIDPVVLEQLVTTAGGEKIPETAWSAGPLTATSTPDDSTALPAMTDESTPSEPEEDVSTEVRGDDQDSAPTIVDDVTAPDDSLDVDARLGQRIPGASFPGVKLVDAVETWAELSGLSVTFDLDAMGQRGIGLEDSIEVQLSDATLGQTLEAILAARQLTYVVQLDQLVVTTRAKKQNTLREVRYSVSDLIDGPPNDLAALAELVQALVAPESWRDRGGLGTMETRGDALVVVQTEPVHYEVLEFCEKLRSARGRPFRSRLDPRRFNLQTRLARARPQLDRSVSVNFHHPTPVLQILEHLEEETETKFVVEWLVLGENSILLQAEVTFKVQNEPLSGALAKLLWPVGLGYRIVDPRTIEVTSRQAAAARLELEFYKVADLVAGGFTSERLIEEIKRQVAGRTWSDAGGPGIVRFDEPSGYLLVRQSQPVQGEIEELVDKLPLSRGNK